MQILGMKLSTCDLSSNHTHTNVISVFLSGDPTTGDWHNIPFFTKLRCFVLLEDTANLLQRHASHFNFHSFPRLIATQMSSINITDYIPWEMEHDLCTTQFNFFFISWSILELIHTIHETNMAVLHVFFGGRIESGDQRT